MDERRRRAYRTLLSAAAMHAKWDLCSTGDDWYQLWRLPGYLRTVRRARRRAVAFHNVAIYACRDFDGFNERWFWRDLESFLSAFPESRHLNYRGMFDATLRGEDVRVQCPGGGVPFVDGDDESPDSATEAINSGD